MSDAPTRIAMWSGPRNISTAMMRAFESRGSTAVSDEPLYAHYLRATGFDHPMAAEIIAHHEPDVQKVTDALIGPVPDGAPVWYQKHMAHHLLATVPRAWLDQLKHAFLIREPAAMLASLTNKLGPATVADTGLPQQVEIFRRVKAATGRTPPVVDARDVLLDPPRMLGLLCEALEIDYRPTMLRWPAGRRSTDGIWAEHWYDAVEASTGFGPYREKRVELDPAMRAVVDDCRPAYEELLAERLH